MRLLFLGVVIALRFTVAIPEAVCQDDKDAREKSHLRMETPYGKAIFLEASSIERLNASKFNVGTGKWSSFMRLQSQNSALSVIHLRGNVVIKMDCFLPLQGPVPICTVLRTHEAEYDEATGEIKASGTVRLNLEPNSK